MYRGDQRDVLMVSMKSGLEGRNNFGTLSPHEPDVPCLNEVRPRRPEQLGPGFGPIEPVDGVSMKSGLEGRNNLRNQPHPDVRSECVSMKSGLEGRNNGTPEELDDLAYARLNEVRPRRPEQ